MKPAVNVRAARVRPRLRELAGATGRRPGLAVAAAFVVTAAYLAAQASRVDDYVWLIDELLYVKIAQSFAGGNLIGAEVYGEGVGLPNALYPYALAPLYAIFGSVRAFEAAHILDALLFASVIFPVYLLARRLSAQWWLALLAGLIAAWAPWAVATTLLMTESLAYPAFAWAAFAVAVALDEPRWRTHALALLAIGIAAYARVQFVLLLPVFVATVVLASVAADNAARRAGVAPLRLRERLRPHAPLGWMLGGVALLLLLLWVTGASPLGTYETATDRMRFPPGWVESSAWHLAHVVLGLGILPAILWLAWIGRAAIAPRRDVELGFAIFSALTVAVLVYTAGDFAQNVAGGTLQERYVFYIAPLLVVGAAALLSDVRQPRPALSLLAAGVLLVAAVGVPDYNPAAGNDGFAIVAAAFTGFVRVVEGRTAGLRELWPGDPLAMTEFIVLFTLLAAVALVVLLRLRRRELVAPAILLAVLAFCAAETHYLLDRAIPSIDASWERLAGESATPRDWVDQAIPDGDEAGVLTAPLFEPGRSDGREVFLRAQFWSESVQRSYITTERSNLVGLPATVLEVEEATGRVNTAEELPYMVVSATDPELRLRGEVVASAAYGLELLRLERPYRAAWTAEGGFTDGYTEGRDERRIVLYGTDPAKVSLTVSAPTEATRPVPYRVRVGDRTRRGTLTPGEATTLELSLPPDVREIGVRAGSVTETGDGRRVGLLVAPVELG